MPTFHVCNFRVDWNNEKNRPIRKKDGKKKDGSYRLIDHNHLCNLKTGCGVGAPRFCDEGNCVIFDLYEKLCFPDRIS